MLKKRGPVHGVPERSTEALLTGVAAEQPWQAITGHTMPLVQPALRRMQRSLYLTIFKTLACTRHPALTEFHMEREIPVHGMTDHFTKALMTGVAGCKAVQYSKR